MNNLLPYCGLVDARISASEKDLPVIWHRLEPKLKKKSEIKPPLQLNQPLIRGYVQTQVCVPPRYKN